MDEYECLDQYFNFPSWSDIDLKQRFSGLCYNEDEYNNSHTTSMLDSNGSSTENSATQDAFSRILTSSSHYKAALNLCDDKKLGCHYNMAVPMNGISSSSLTNPETGNSQCNSLEPSVFQSFQNDYRVVSQIPRPSPVPSLEGVTSHSGLGQDGIGGFGLQRGCVDGDFYGMENLSSNFSASVSSKGTHDLRSYPLPSFASGLQMTVASNGLQSQSQTSTTTQPGECNGTVKPRVRARRGQATDPHSIAERFRREKIADRMKNLQELVPNSNKTDKASMLKEIIEYVKFLQLQVKVLSMSRLGAAGAVVPLITDCQAEGGNGLLLSPSSGQIADVVFPSDETVFERELVKLMESNVSKAMQFLQTKGLCLMPIALASAMSPGKEK